MGWVVNPGAPAVSGRRGETKDKSTTAVVAGTDGASWARRGEPCSMDDTTMTADEAAIAALVGCDTALDDEPEEDEFDLFAMGGGAHGGRRGSTCDDGGGFGGDDERGMLALDTEVPLVGNVWEERCARLDKVRATLARQSAADADAADERELKRRKPPSSAHATSVATESTAVARISDSAVAVDMSSSPSPRIADTMDRD